MVSKYNPLTINVPPLNYTYKVEKPLLTETLNKLSVMQGSQIQKFLENHGNHSNKRYYSPIVGENFDFHTSYNNSGMYFNYQDYATSNGPSTILDPIRRLCGLFWTQEYVQKSNSRYNSVNFSNIAFFRSVVDESHIPMTVNFTSYKKSSEDSLESEEWVLLNTNVSHLSKDEEYRSLIEDNVFDRTYEDFTFSGPKFYEKSDFNSGQDGVLTNFAEVKGDYNYFDRDYELASYPTYLHEAMLPNMYVFFAYQEQPSEAQNPAYKSLLTLNGKIDINKHQEMFSAEKKEVSQKRITPTEKYFSSWSNVANTLQSTAQIGNIVFKYGNIHLSAEDVKKIQSYGGRKELFPMWMDIQFTTDRIVEFAETLKETQVMGLLQSSLMEAIRSGSLSSERVVTAFTQKNNTVRQVSESHITGIPMQLTNTESSLSYFDMSSWMEDIVNGAAFPTDLLYSTFLGTLDESMRVTNEPKYDFFKSLMSVILKGKIRKLLRKHCRTMQEIFSGKQCYNETVMYRIEKHDGDNSNGAPLQTFYVPNSQELDVFQYIDTQVKYGKKYTYVIYAYQMVVGNKYSYIDSEFRRDSGGWSSMLVRNEPSLRIYEQEVYKKTNILMDNPAVSPEVQFVPYKGVKDKIKIVMNSGVGRYTLPYQTIEFEEQEQYRKMQEAQNKDIVSDILTFETDDYPSFYEIRRMGTKPKSYKDFAGKLVQRISTEQDDLIASGAAFVDKIKPNKKYYYCIRAIDNHGSVSYPSPVYEVEMVDDKGSVYPIVRVVEFEEEVKSQNNISARRYLRISPSMAQTILNEEASELIDADTVVGVDDVVLGVAEESVWDRKFKIRLVSKSTGRKIDFNVKFTHEHDKLSEDI